MTTNQRPRCGASMVLLGWLAVGWLAPTGWARIKLVALPERAATVIRLDNPAATLIEEERVLTLQQGANQVDFSWKAVSIDEDSIRLAVLDHPDRVTLLSVSYPPGEQALVWEIAAAEPVQERVRISYLLSNIDRLVTYKAVADKAETKLDLKSFLVLRNFSGEDFDLAHVVLDYGEAFERGIRHEETKQLLFFGKPDVPLRKVWTWDAARLPWDPEQLNNRNVGIPVTYEITNNDRSRLGQFALWGGKARVFQDDGRGGTIFLGEDAAELVPVGEKMKLYVGDSRDLVVTQRKMREQQVNLRRNNRNEIILFDSDEVIAVKIENFKDSPAVLTLLEHVPGEWKMTECNLPYKLEDSETLKFEIELPPRRGDQPAAVNLEMHYQRLNIRPDRPVPSPVSPQAR